jgi:uncharacterized membrane protein YfcA
MNHALIIAGLIGCVSLLYATAGQAGGTAFLAVMTFAAFPATEMRATALLLNIVAAGYATWRLHRSAVIDRTMLLPLTVPSLVAAFLARLSQLDPGFDNLAPAGCLMKPGLGRPGRAGTD